MQYRFQANGQVYEIELEPRGAGYHAVVDGQAYEVEVLDVQPGQLSLLFHHGGAANRPVTLYWADHGGSRWIALNGCTYRLEKPAPRRAQQSSEAGGSETVRAPMPAQVREVQVREGSSVEKGQTLMLLEAMKMEIRIKAPAQGRVTHLPVKDGQAVEKEQVLAKITPVQPAEITPGEDQGKELNRKDAKDADKNDAKKNKDLLEKEIG